MAQGVSPSLLAAYTATAYRIGYPVDGGGLRHFDLRIGQVHEAFRDGLQQRQVTAWAILTASNPASRLLGLAENRLRQQQLQRCLSASAYSVFPGVNLADDPGWPPEATVLVLHQSLVAAARFAARFGQYAFVAGDTGAVPRLCLTRDHAAGTAFRQDGT